MFRADTKAIFGMLSQANPVDCEDCQRLLQYPEFYQIGDEKIVEYCYDCRGDHLSCQRVQEQEEDVNNFMQDHQDMFSIIEWID